MNAHDQFDGAAAFARLLLDGRSLFLRAYPTRAAVWRRAASVFRILKGLKMMRGRLEFGCTRPWPGPPATPSDHVSSPT